MAMTSRHVPEARSWYRSRYGLTLAAFLGIAAFFLITEHKAHVLGFLPYLLLLACPLLHFFMHGRHGNQHGGHGSQEGSTGRPGDEAHR